MSNPDEADWVEPEGVRPASASEDKKATELKQVLRPVMGASAEAYSQGLAKEKWILGFRRRFGLLTWSMFAAAIGSIIAAVTLIQEHAGWEPISGAVVAAIVTSAPIIEAIHPPLGVWIRSFFRSS